MLPAEITDLLKQNQVCCLGTVHDEEPYLSVMFYTYLEKEGILIMSSQSQSTKVRNMIANPRVAVLVQAASKSADSKAITLFGTVKMEDGPKAVNYLQMHRQAHTLDSGFLSGSNITVLTLKPSRVVMADQNDQVSYWSI